MAIEDTQVKAVTREEEDILTAWLTAEKAKEPGQDLGVIRDPELPEGVAARYHSIESAGWIYVYHQETGDKSIINMNMLKMQLRKKLSNGKPAFGLRAPVNKEGAIIKPKVGTIKCYLHQDRPEREQYAALGFPTCPKDNISNQHSLELHMAHRHQSEWAEIKGTRERTEREEDRVAQRHLYEALAIQLGKGSEQQGNSTVSEAKPTLDSTQYLTSGNVTESSLLTDVETTQKENPKPVEAINKKRKGRPKKVKKAGK